MTARKILIAVIGLALAGLAVWYFMPEKKAEPLSEAAQQLQTDPQLAELTAALEKDPNNDTLLYLRASTYYKLDAYDEAMADLEKAMRIDSMQPAHYHLLADVLLDYARPNDSKRAIEVLKLAAQRFPDRIPTLLKLSEFQLIVKKHGDALATLDKILQRDPQNAEAFYMAGRVALDKGDTTNAIASLQKSVKIDAENADAWFFLGRIFGNRNNPLAVQYFDNALRVDSTYLEAQEFKAVYYKKKGDYDKAFSIYRDLLLRDPDYANAYFDMGIIYLELDSLSKAYDNFNIATKVDPIFVKAYYYRGVASEKMGNKEAALADYKQASGMAPEFQEAQEAKSRLERG
ncbi:MAG TPA: tetratricopeptide repeat protein [Saprospiraceae bacterium]|nr:tetratricopeptide repeat protein [Saprospiraceae bacterium]